MKGRGTGPGLRVPCFPRPPHFLPSISSLNISPRNADKKNMRVVASNVYAGATHSSLTATEINESLRVWAGEPGGAPPAPAEDRVFLSAEACRPCEPVAVESEDMLSPHLLIAKLIIEEFTGTKVDLSNIARLNDPPPEIELQKKGPGASGPSRDGNAGWGVAYDRSETYREEEALSFNVRGVVRTADGQDIHFALDLKLNRTFAEQSSVRLRAGDAARIDPLVINFGRPAAELTSGRFAFDLDSDGREESISTPAGGSGFLVLDRNGDGAINDGRELFGPSTGKGFAELAQFDTDGNGWIDENDDAYDRLRIWTQDGEGNEAFHPLRERDVGAIYLSALGSPFDYKDGANNLQGTVRQTGIFLRESGSAGSIQQIDFAV